MARGEFWRRRNSQPSECIEEAYLWGTGIGGRPTARALSMLLLPFTLINVAYWARPPRRQGLVSWAADESVGMICRLLGLTLTATLTLAAAGSAMDLLAWQCLSVAGCTGEWSQPFSLIGETPLTAGQWLAIGAGVPLLLLAVLWYHSYRTWRRYERRVDIGRRTDELTLARFWRGRDWVKRLRATHVVAGMSIVDGLMTYAMAASDSRQGSSLSWLGYTLLAASCVTGLMAIIGAVAPLPVAAPSLRDPLRQPPSQANPGLRQTATATYFRAVARTETAVENLRVRARTAASTLSRALRVAVEIMVVVTVAVIAYAAWPRRTVVLPAHSMPGYAGLVAILSCVQTILLFALGAAIVVLCWTTRRDGHHLALHGFTAPIMATTATMLAVAEAAGTLYFTALSIGQLKPSTAGRAWEPAPPYPYEWAGLVFALALACSAVAGAFLAVVWRRLVHAGSRLTDRRDGALRRADPDIAELIDHAHARGWILGHLTPVALIVFVPVAVLSIIGVGYSAVGHGPAALRLPAAASAFGTWSIGLISVIVVYGVARAGAMTPVRRIIGTVWALATFWPRAAHPFGAPAHGPRAVADVVSRVTRLTEQGSSVLIAGHSHGALIATAAARYLPASVVEKTALLTSASPVARLIEPFFGAFFNRRICQEIAESLADDGGVRWRNLYRLTDPLGGPLFADEAGRPSSTTDAWRHVDTLVPDPPTTAVGLGLDPTPRGHGDYLHDPIFVREHTRLVGLLAAPDADAQLHA